MGKQNAYPCSLELSMDLVGGKWKMVILWHLRQGTLRFNELRRRLSGITQKMLTQQLRELEKFKLVTRKVHAVVPPKVEYSLTAEGSCLIPILSELCDWANSYAQGHDITLTQPICPDCSQEMLS